MYDVLLEKENGVHWSNNVVLYTGISEAGFQHATVEDNTDTVSLGGSNKQVGMA